MSRGGGGPCCMGESRYGCPGGGGPLPGGPPYGLAPMPGGGGGTASGGVGPASRHGCPALPGGGPPPPGVPPGVCMPGRPRLLEYMSSGASGRTQAAAGNFFRRPYALERICRRQAAKEGPQLELSHMPQKGGTPTHHTALPSSQDFCRRWCGCCGVQQPATDSEFVEVVCFHCSPQSRWTGPGRAAGLQTSRAPTACGACRRWSAAATPPHAASA